MSENDPTNETIETDASTLVDWENPPSLADLKADHEAAHVAHDVHTQPAGRPARLATGVHI